MKFHLTNEAMIVNGVELRRIQALQPIPSHGVRAGDLGGWVADISCLSQAGKAWIGGNAQVLSGYARVEDDAFVGGNAKIWDYAVVHQRARVVGNACVSGEGQVAGRAVIEESACVGEYAEVYGHARLAGQVQAIGTAIVGGFLTARGEEVFTRGFWDENGDLSAMTTEMLVDLAQARMLVVNA